MGPGRALESFLAKWGHQPHDCRGSSHAFLTQPEGTPFSSDLGHSVLRILVGLHTEAVRPGWQGPGHGPSPWALLCPWSLPQAQMVLPSPPTQLRFSQASRAQGALSCRLLKEGLWSRGEFHALSQASQASGLSELSHTLQLVPTI